MNIYITGISKMIGFHLFLFLNKLGYKISGTDNLNDYYDIKLKKGRTEILSQINVG